MRKPNITSTNLTKTNIFCGLQRSNLLFIKHFESTIECMRASLGIAAPNALFSCDDEFVCVRRPLFIWRTYALIIQTHMRPNLTARATQLPSLSLLKTVAL